MSLTEGKKTYIGIIIAAIPTVAGLFGYNVEVEGAQEIGGLLGTLADSVSELIEVSGLLIAAYGRSVTKG